MTFDRWSILLCEIVEKRVVVGRAEAVKPGCGAITVIVSSYSPGCPSDYLSPDECYLPASCFNDIIRPLE